MRDSRINWAVHPRFPLYEISDCGTVRRAVAMGYRPAFGKVSGRVLVSGYRQFKLLDVNGEKVFVRANRLILEAFRGLCPDLQLQAAHNDGNRLNNYLYNLRWASPKENTSDKIIHGKMQIGEKSRCAKLNDVIADKIRSDYTGARGDIIRISRKYSVSTSCIWRVVHRKQWWPPSSSALDQRRAAQR